MDLEVKAAMQTEEDVEEIEEDEDEEEDIEDEELDDLEEEELDGEHPPVTVGRRSGRGLTLKTLLKEKVLDPGEGTMTINYLGNKFKGDLLPDGRIRSQETGKVFGTPSAWAIFCKKIVNPDKKSGCGWASVRYRGKKLDSYKNSWFRQKRLEEKEEEMEDDEVSSCESEGMIAGQEIIEFETLGNRNVNHDQSMMVELVSFQSIGKLQPFNITMSSSAMAVIDVHGHLTTSEVLGYLAGQWDVNNHNLIVSHAFPMKCQLTDAKGGAACQKSIFEEMERLKLSLVGWYHTHPTTAPLPTLRDIDLQLDNEIRMKGYSDSSYTPVIGIVASPYQKSPIQTKGLPHLSGNATGYWVAPPPENKPLEYGRPFSMQFAVVKDAFVPKEALLHMDCAIKYYQGKADSVTWLDIFEEKITHWHQLLKSLKGRVPKDHYPHLVEFLKRSIGENLPDEEVAPTIVPLPPTPDAPSIAPRKPMPGLDLIDALQSTETTASFVSSLMKDKPPAKSHSPQFQHPLPPLFPLDTKARSESQGSSETKMDASIAIPVQLPKTSAHQLPSKSSSHDTTSHFLDLSLKSSSRPEAEMSEKPIESNFGLSTWFAQQKFTQDVFALPPHERDHPFSTDILHRELSSKAPVDIPSKWNTGLNLGKEPADRSYIKTPPVPNFSFSLEPPPPYQPRSEESKKQDSPSVSHLLTEHDGPPPAYPTQTSSN